MATTIQSNIEGLTNRKSPQVVRASTGRLYSVYQKDVSGTDSLAVAYSDDNGSTWTETATVAETITVGVEVAIDSTDKLHILYGGDGYVVYYRSFASGSFGAEETIFNGTTDTDSNNNGASIAVDNSDIPHVAWSQHYPTKDNYGIYYSNRSGGSWATRTLISTNNPDVADHAYPVFFFLVEYFVT